MHAPCPPQLPLGRGPFRALALLTLTTLTLGLTGPRAAVADPLADARARASALADQITTLRHQTEVAVEHYDLVTGKLAAAVARHSTAVARADAAQRDLLGQQDIVRARARALYISGGELALYGTALTAGSPAVLADRIELAQRIARSTAAAGKDVAAQSTAAADDLLVAAGVAEQQADLERQAAAKAGEVAMLLQQTQGLLDSADAQVALLEQQEEQRRQAAAQVRFQALLAQARDGLGSAIQGQPGDETPAGPEQVTALAAITTRAGVPYQWGGTGPDRYDCSGLTGFAYSRAGIRLPRTAAQQWLAGPQVPLSDLRAGDLLFWADSLVDPGTIHHVAMYAGGGLMWSTDNTGDVARLQPVFDPEGLIGANRPTAAQAATVAPPFWSGA